MVVDIFFYLNRYQQYFNIFLGRQYGCDGFNNITAVKKTPTGETFKDGTPKYKKEKYNPWLENKEWASPPLYTGCPLNGKYSTPKSRFNKRAGQTTFVH